LKNNLTINGIGFFVAGTGSTRSSCPLGFNNMDFFGAESNGMRGSGLGVTKRNDLFGWIINYNGKYLLEMSIMTFLLENIFTPLFFYFGKIL
jgi:hypothetical protein